MAEADLRFLAEIGKTYALGRTTSLELQDTIFRVGMREIIQSWRQSADTTVRQLGASARRNLSLGRRGGFRVQKTTHEYVGGHQSISIPLGHGVRFKTGAFRGHREDHTSWENAGVGVLHVASQRVCFTGSNQSVAIPLQEDD